MINPEVVRKRLLKLDEYLAILDRQRHYSLEALRNRLDDLREIRQAFARLL